MKTDKQLLYEISRRVNAEKRNSVNRVLSTLFKLMASELMLIIACISIVIFIVFGGD